MFKLIRKKHPPFCALLSNLVLRLPLRCSGRAKRRSGHRGPFLFFFISFRSAWAVEQILMKQSRQRNLLYDLVTLLKQGPKSKSETAFEEIFKKIVEFDPEPLKFARHFRKFVEVLKKDLELLSLLEYVLGREHQQEKVEDDFKKFTGGLEKYELPKECVDTIKSLLQRCLPFQFNGGAVEVLVDKIVTAIKSIEDFHKESSDRCHRLLRLLEHCFEMMAAIQYRILEPEHDIRYGDQLMLLVLATSNTSALSCASLINIFRQLLKLGST
ncbi:unnamed protein product [Gongylonema pulchrum]|uniref:MIF4G domain-containing protein n=1 Tax=Gongylonema pulchrum TaxID=637853 RepID=A0A183E8I3_9BILA|nr:unnamed protein product [Gongylonema pulchrum]